MSGALFPFVKDIGAMNLGCTHIFRVILMLTARCPLQCRICSIWKDHEKADPELHDVERFFSTNSFSWINLTGGEIFMRPDMAAIFEVIKKTQTDLRYLSLPTSGYLVDRTVSDVEAAIRCGLKHLSITVSFDGGAEAHNSLRRGDQPFQRAEKTFHILRDLAARSQGALHVIPGLTLSSELFELTRDPVGDLVNALRLDNVQDVHVNLSHRASHYYHNPDLATLPKERTVHYLRELLRQGRPASTPLKVLERLYLKGAIQYLETGKPPLECKACKASVFVDSQWKVFPCTHFADSMGSLHDFDFDLSRLVSSPAFGDAVKKISNHECPGCWTPCEAFTSLAGSVLKPSFYKLAASEAGFGIRDGDGRIS